MELGDMSFIAFRQMRRVGPFPESLEWGFVVPESGVTI